MVYCKSDLSSIMSKFWDKLSIKLSRANEDGTIKNLMEDWGVFFEERMPICERTAVILIIGELSGNKSDYIRVAKKFGISERQL